MSRDVGQTGDTLWFRKRSVNAYGSAAPQVCRPCYKYRYVPLLHVRRRGSVSHAGPAISDQPRFLNQYKSAAVKECCSYMTPHRLGTLVHCLTCWSVLLVPSMVISNPAMIVSTFVHACRHVSLSLQLDVPQQQTYSRIPKELATCGVKPPRQ